MTLRAIGVAVIVAVIAYMVSLHDEGGPLGWMNARAIIAAIVCLLSLGVIAGLLIAMWLP